MRVDSPRPRVSSVAFLLTVGLLSLVWGYKVLLEPRPFWTGVTDLEMDYFFNSLKVASGERPAYAVHPGTPIQCVGGLIALGLRAGPGECQAFLTLGYVLGLAITLVALWTFFSSIMRGLHVGLQMAIALAIFVNPASLLYMGYWGSEMFLVAFGLLAWCSLWWAFRGTSPPTMYLVVLSGLCTGMACAVKIVYVPVALGALVGYAVSALAGSVSPISRFTVSRTFWMVWVVLSLGYLGLILGTHFWKQQPDVAAVLWSTCLGNLLVLVTTACLSYSAARTSGWRVRMIAAIRVSYEYLFGLMLGWLLGTWPVFRLSGEVLRHIVDGFRGNVVNTDRLVSWTDLFPEFMRLLLAVPGWTLLVLTAWVLVAVTIGRLLKRRSQDRTWDLGFAALVLTSLALGLSAALKNRAVTGMPYQEMFIGVDLRWFMPVAVGVAVAMAWLAHQWSDSVGVTKTARARTAWVAAILVLGLFAHNARRDMLLHRRIVEVGQWERRAVDRWLGELARRLGREPVVLTWGLWRPSAALLWGDRYVLRRFKTAVDALNPSEGMYDVSRRAAMLPSGKASCDLILVKESGLMADPEGAEAGYRNLQAMGTIERWSEGLPEPLVIVRTSPAAQAATGRRDASSAEPVLPAAAAAQRKKL